MSTRRFVLAALLAVAGTVRADLVAYKEAAQSSPLLMSQRVFSHVMAPGEKTWAARELERLRQKRVGLTRLPGMKPPHSEGTETAQPADPLRGAIHEDATTWDLADVDGPYGDTAAGGLEIESTASEEGGESGLRDVPKIAVSVADALKEFSDRSVQLVFILRRLLGRARVVDVNRSVARRAGQESSHVRNSEREQRRLADKAKARAALEREKARRNIKRVVTSAFRIGIGVVIGWILWLFVRRSFR